MGGGVEEPRQSATGPLHHLTDRGVPEPAQRLGDGTSLSVDPDGSHRPRRRPVRQPRLVPVQRHLVVVPTGIVAGVGGTAHVVRVPR
jgi:hypothetical protein